MPPDLSVRVSAIEARLTELNLQYIHEKLNLFEDNINTIKNAFINLDDKVNLALQQKEQN